MEVFYEKCKNNLLISKKLKDMLSIKRCQSVLINNIQIKQLNDIIIN